MPNPHDIDLLKDIRATFDEDLLVFLRTHAFESLSLNSSVMRPLHKIKYGMVGAKYEFQDTEVQTAWELLKSRISESLA